MRRTADYIFFQTPYQLYKKEFSYLTLASHSKICYIPYHGPLIYRGEVAAVTQPDIFALVASYIFSHPLETCLDTAKKSRFRRKSVMVGSPMFESIQMQREPCLTTPKTVLWTPRWRTSEGNCGFFDYIETMIQVCKENPGLTVKLRAHPLFFMNLERTGELSEKSRRILEERLDSLGNFIVDNQQDLSVEMKQSDLFVSDMSSILVEIIATAKPIIYTHKTDSFNELGSMISEGLYWVRSSEELMKRIESLRVGEDPLFGERKALATKLRDNVRDTLIADFANRRRYGS
jgi:CDP-glycerol glycerophosphotransferase (TagB/SpsB family)